MSTFIPVPPRHLAPLFDNPKLDKELRAMLREKFPEFCSSPSPPVEGTGPSYSSRLRVRVATVRAEPSLRSSPALGHCPLGSPSPVGIFVSSSLLLPLHLILSAFR